MIKKLLYKLLYDLFFLALLTLAIFLATESVFPYILTDKVTFTQIIIIILAIIFVLAFLFRRNDFSNKDRDFKENKKSIALWIVFSIFVFLFTLKRFDIFSGIVITIFSLIVIFQFKNLLLKSKN